MKRNASDAEKGGKNKNKTAAQEVFGQKRGEKEAMFKRTAT